MPEIEIRPPQCIVDFSISSSPTHTDLSHFALHDHLILSNNHDSVHSPPSQFYLRSGLSRDHLNRNIDDELIFRSLPPLLHGHAEIHLRNGVMNAACLSAAHEPDAERAFFVADLGKVYRQHERWQKCLPEIKPFYGSSNYPRARYRGFSTDS
jgi:ornithine decarboxylase